MPPVLTFEAIDVRAAATPAHSATLDLAGERRPRCVVPLPPASGPGLYHGLCGCGASFVCAVLGADDPEVAYVACWGRDQTPAAGPTPGATLFSPRR